MSLPLWLVWESEFGKEKHAFTSVEHTVDGNTVFSPAKVFRIQACTFSPGDRNTTQQLKNRPSEIIVSDPLFCVPIQLSAQPL